MTMRSRNRYVKKGVIMMSSHFQLKTAFCMLFCTTICMFFYTRNVLRIEVEEGAISFSSLKYHVFDKLKPLTSNRTVDFKRKTLLNRMCMLYSNKTGSMKDNAMDKKIFDHILVDHKHKLLYCYVPKVACTNWKRMFMILTEKANTTDALAIPASIAHGRDVFPSLSNYSEEEIQYLLHSYTKFTFVRHPFERLLSAYHNKLEQHYASSKYFQVRFGRHIVRHYRTSPSEEALLKGNDVTFQEFVTYLTNPEDSVFNEHWMPAHNLCEPCVINYDIVGKYETLSDDARHILNMVGEPNLVFPQITKPTNTSSKLNKYFSRLPKPLIWKLYDIYLMDFKLFGYDIDRFM